MEDDKNVDEDKNMDATRTIFSIKGALQQMSHCAGS